MHHFVTFVLEKVVTRVIITEGCTLDRVTVNIQEVALHKEDKEPADYAKEMTITTHKHTHREEMSSTGKSGWELRRLKFTVLTSYLIGHKNVMFY